MMVSAAVMHREAAKWLMHAAPRGCAVLAPVVMSPLHRLLVGAALLLLPLPLVTTGTVSTGAPVHPGDKPAPGMPDPPSGWPKYWSTEWKKAALTRDFPTAKVFDDVLPQKLLAELHTEAVQYHKANEVIGRRQATKETGMKKPTVWLDTKTKVQTQKPRFFIEEAVASLRSLINVTDFGLGSHIQIMGGEWWVHSCSMEDSLPFHYDKDERMVVHHWKMSYPVLSTITYLDDVGAPTLILNQTLKEDHETGAAEDDPLVPEYGTLVYPKRGRHVIFRGDLQVCGSPRHTCFGC